jgi:hypothetical protein
MIRIVLYSPSPPWVTPSVHMEFDRISNVYVRRNNAGIRDVFLDEVQPRDLDLGLVTARARALQAHHSDEDDCRAVAEAEVAGAVWFLSFDTDLLARLAPHTTLALMKPSEYWPTLGIPRGAEPGAPNPLASKSW